MDWPTHKNVLEFRSFMGLSGYYRRFIEDFSNIAHPINYLPKKGIKFDWNLNVKQVLRSLKRCLLMHRF